MCTTTIHMGQKPYHLWRNHLYQILLSRGSSYHWVLPKCLAHTQDRRMMDFIFPKSKSTPMDGPMDVQTPTIIPIWEFALGTHFRTLRDDQLCSTPCFETIWGKTVCFGYWWVSLIRNGQSENTQVLSQVMQAWKDPHRTRLGQLIGGCTPEYTV